jgi:hypothetical protein
MHQFFWLDIQKLLYTKAKLFLCFTKHHNMKMYEAAEVHLYGFLNSTLDGGEWSASDPSGHFIPCE